MQKNIVDNPVCELCLSEEETPDHIIHHCPFAADFWRRVGGTDMMIAPAKELWRSTFPSSMPKKSASTFLLLCCWELWKDRNSVVFWQEQPDLRRLMASCKEAASSWSRRLPSRLKSVTTMWKHRSPVHFVVFHSEK